MTIAGDYWMTADRGAVGMVSQVRNAASETVGTPKAAGTHVDGREVTLGGMTLAAQRAAYVRRLEEAVQRIRTILADVPGIQRVSLFGSYARGRRDLFTDLDLFVVWDTDRPLLERQRYLYPLLAVPVDLDIVCYTPAELEAAADSPFNRRILREEVVLFETKPA